METLSLGNKQTLSLVRVDGQELLIAGTGNAVSLLAMLDSNQDLPAELADVKHLVASFYSKAP
jgi:flagellar biogenesis protein FliO